MSSSIVFLSVIFMALGAHARALASIPACASLTADEQKTARGLFTSLHPYDGCDETFDVCLAKEPPHPVVTRLAGDICRLVKAGKKKPEIERALMRRAESALPLGKQAVIALDPRTLAGAPEAPVTAVVYACARCPFCRVFVLGLFEAVNQGPLKGKVKLYFRPFPIKGHEGALEGGLAMQSAAQLGHFWPYTVHLYERYDAFSPNVLADWAVTVGMEPAAFAAAYADPKTREEVARSKQEGLRNKVFATPTLFVNGRKYLYELDREVVIDFLLEELERLRAP